MAIKNFSTSIDSFKTISEIQQLLSKKGAQNINIKNDAQGNPVALMFVVLWNLQPVAFALPCNFEGIEKAMRKSRVPERLCTREQALRVGWRIIKDWTAAQLAIVEAEACTMAQVFLPYAVTTKGETVYEMFESTKSKELLQLNNGN